MIILFSEIHFKLTYLLYITICIIPNTRRNPPIKAAETVSMKHCEIPWSIHTSPKVTFGGQYSIWPLQAK